MTLNFTLQLVINKLIPLELIMIFNESNDFIYFYEGNRTDKGSRKGQTVKLNTDTVRRFPGNLILT